MLYKAIKRSVTTPAFTDWSKRGATDIKNSTLKERGAKPRASIENWKEEIKAAGIQPQ